MAGDFEIILSVHIGDREVVVGENQADRENTYMCAFCQQNELFAKYEDVLSSDDYAEIVEIFGQRIAGQAEKTRQELITPKIQGINTAALTAKDCTPISHDDDLNGKVIVIRPDVLRREYQRATNQVKLCTGGFGAYPHSRGSACYCVDLYSGKESRFERQDVLGILSTEQMPEWAEHFLQQRSQEQQKKKQARKEER